MRKRGVVKVIPPQQVKTPTLEGMYAANVTHAHSRTKIGVAEQERREKGRERERHEVAVARKRGRIAHVLQVFFLTRKPLYVRLRESAHTK